MSPEPGNLPTGAEEHARHCEAHWDNPTYARLSAQRAAPFAAWAVNRILSKAHLEFAPRPTSYGSWEDMMHDLADYLYPRIVGSHSVYESGVWSQLAWQLKFVCERIDDDDPALGPNGPWAPLLLPLLDHYFKGGREPDLRFPFTFRDALHAMPRWWVLDPFWREQSASVRWAVGQINRAFREAGIVFDPPESREVAWEHFSAQFVAFLVPQLANPLHAGAAGEALGAFLTATGVNRPYGVASTQCIRFFELLREAINDAPGPFRTEADGPQYRGLSQSFVNPQLVSEMSPLFADWLQREWAAEEESLRQGAMGY